MLTQTPLNTKIPRSHNQNWLRSITIVIGLLGLTVLILAPLPKIPGRDSGVFLYTGQAILNGKIPYRDVWDHKPPLIFFIDAFGLALAGGSRWGVWILEVVAIGVSALVSFKLLQSAFGFIPAVFGSMGWLLSLTYLLQGDNFTEEFALPLQFLALYTLLWLLKRERFGWGGLGLGLTFGLTFFLKQNVVMLWVAISLYLFLWLAFRSRWSDLLKYMGGFLIASSGVVLLMLAYFAFNNSLDYFVDTAFRYNFAYSSNTSEARLSAIVSGLLLLAQGRISTIALVSWPLALVFIYRQRRVFTPLTILLTVAVIDLPLEAISSSLSGRIYSHYFISMLPSLAVLNAFFFYALLNYWIPGFNRWLLGRKSVSGLKDRREVELSRRNRLLALAILLPFLAVMWFVPTVYIYARYVPPSLTGEQSSTQAAIDYVNLNTQPADYLLLWGAETNINVVTGRLAPSRFVYQYPLFNYPARREEFVKEFLQNLQSRPPSLIIDSTSAGGNEIMPPLDATARLQWQNDWPGQPLPANVNLIFEYVNQHYHVVEQLGQDKWTAYALNK